MTDHTSERDDLSREFSSSLPESASIGRQQRFERSVMIVGSKSATVRRALATIIRLANAKERSQAGARSRFARRVSGLIVVLANLALPVVAQAPVRPDAGRGKDLVQRFCAGCHLMPGAGGPVAIGVPTLGTIANEPNQTGTRIARGLLNPHPPMPNANLGRDEINDIVMYLNSLRTDQTKPLIEVAPDVPKHPKPS